MENLTITCPITGIKEPAKELPCGTIVSLWNNLPDILINGENGIERISHELAKELDYEI